MSQVEVTDATKHFGAVAALDGVTLTFVEGELFGLLGPSGSGKTTLLRAIAGFVELDRGEIRIDGADVSRLPVHQRNIGMMFQSYALFPHMSVAENIAFGLEMRKLSPDEIRREVGEILDLVHLPGLGERRPKQLSGGQQQRVALARALVTRPRVLLLDEPLSALDKHLRQEMQVELKRIQRQVGITTIFVTHDQEEALTLSDRIAILDHGRLVEMGRPRDMYERPKSRFAASFLGEANFLDGTVTDISEGIAHVVLAGGGAATLPAGDLKPGATVLIALRPERTHLKPGIGDIGPNRLSGRILSAVFSGSSLTYRVAAGERILLVFEQNRSAERLADGAEVTLSWDASDNVLVSP